jgi:hypothetical protein
MTLVMNQSLLQYATSEQSGRNLSTPSPVHGRASLEKEANVLARGSDYTQAPACGMIAAHCAVCSLPLVDAVSVETGLGPVCREKHGFHIDVDEATRKTANRLVHAIACCQDGPDVGVMCDRLRALGFEKLAAKILDRVATVKLTIEDTVLVLRSPYSEEAVDKLRKVPGRRWDGERKVNTFPMSSRQRLWEVLVSLYEGQVGIGSRGTFMIERKVGC